MRPLGGRVGLVVLAVALAPAVIKKSKHLSKYIGQQLIDLGEFLKKDNWPEPPPKVEEAPMEVQDAEFEEAEDLAEEEIQKSPGQDVPVAEAEVDPAPEAAPTEIPKDFQPDPAE